MIPVTPGPNNSSLGPIVPHGSARSSKKAPLKGLPGQPDNEVLRSSVNEVGVNSLTKQGESFSKLKKGELNTPRATLPLGESPVISVEEIPGDDSPTPPLVLNDIDVEISPTSDKVDLQNPKTKPGQETPDLKKNVPALNRTSNVSAKVLSPSQMIVEQEVTSPIRLDRNGQEIQSTLSKVGNALKGFFKECFKAVTNVNIASYYWGVYPHRIVRLGSDSINNTWQSKPKRIAAHIALIIPKVFLLIAAFAASVTFRVLMITAQVIKNIVLTPFRLIANFFIASKQPSGSKWKIFGELTIKTIAGYLLGDVYRTLVISHVQSKIFFNTKMRALDYADVCWPFKACYLSGDVNGTSPEVKKPFSWMDFHVTYKEFLKQSMEGISRWENPGTGPIRTPDSSNFVSKPIEAFAKPALDADITGPVAIPNPIQQAHHESPPHSPDVEIPPSTT